MDELMYRVDDMRNTRRHKILYYATLEDAENYAVLTMNSICDKLPSQAWGRTEWGGNIMEYTERNAPGTAQVYIRVFREPELPKLCKCGEHATICTREGYSCHKHDNS